MGVFSMTQLVGAAAQEAYKAILGATRPAFWRFRRVPRSASLHRAARAVFVRHYRRYAMAGARPASRRTRSRRRRVTDCIDGMRALRSLPWWIERIARE
jgi:hypothetical protein